MPEPSPSSRWRSLPSWLLEGFARGAPWAIAIVVVGSPGAAGLATMLLLVLSRLEHSLRRAGRPLRWLAFGSLVVPVIALGLCAIQGQAAYVSTLREGASLGQATRSALEFLRADSLDDLAPALGGGIVLSAMSALRLRLLGPRATLALGVILIASPLVKWPSLGSELLSVPGVLAGLIPLGAFLGYLADLTECWIEALARRDEGRFPRGVATLREELVQALRRGEAPWETCALPMALGDHEAAHQQQPGLGPGGGAGGQGADREA